MVYVQQELKRKLAPAECFATHLLPTNGVQQNLCDGVKLELENIPTTALTKMAGNAMNLPCVGAVLLAAMMRLSKK